MPRTALLGWTGFVGSNLHVAHAFDDLYNSSNLSDIAGRSYDLVVSAAARADSYRINQDEAGDRAEIEEIAGHVRRATIGRLVLVSTVCVYPGDTSPDEATPITTRDLTPYGRNRVLLEELLQERFATTVLRLPQLYGRGLKKGIVHDLLRDHRVEHIRPDGRFQYYDLGRLWADVQVALDAGLDALNVATPALTSARVAAEVFGRDIGGQVPPEPESPFSRMYTRDMRTRHASLFGRDGPYLQTEDEEIRALRTFVDTARAASA